MVTRHTREQAPRSCDFASMDGLWFCLSIHATLATPPKLCRSLLLTADEGAASRITPHPSPRLLLILEGPPSPRASADRSCLILPLLQQAISSTKTYSWRVLAPRPHNAPASSQGGRMCIDILEDGGTPKNFRTQTAVLLNHLAPAQTWTSSST